MPKSKKQRRNIRINRRRALRLANIQRIYGTETANHFRKQSYGSGTDKQHADRDG